MTAPYVDIEYWRFAREVEWHDTQSVAKIGFRSWSYDNPCPDGTGALGIGVGLGLGPPAELGPVGVTGAVCPMSIAGCAWIQPSMTSGLARTATIIAVRKRTSVKMSVTRSAEARVGRSKEGTVSSIGEHARIHR
jgi:hypothetical protein